MSTDIPVGPELDAAVAKKCGWKNKIETICPEYGQPYKGCVLSDFSFDWMRDDRVFNPSTDLNAAFEAAEKFGLFVFGRTESDGSRFLDRVIDGGVERWRVCQHVYVLEELTMGGEVREMAIRPFSSGATPAEAICRAILKMEDAK